MNKMLLCGAPLTILVVAGGHNVLDISTFLMALRCLHLGPILVSVLTTEVEVKDLFSSIVAQLVRKQDGFSAKYLMPVGEH